MSSWILGIESSCDDTSVALVNEEGEVGHMVSAHQNAFHEVFGGVVPEIASRQHTEWCVALIEKCLSEARVSPAQLTHLAVTARPGLLGSLLVGTVTAQTLGLAWRKPVIPINHLEGHILAGFLRRSDEMKKKIHFPFWCLVVSGGHSALYLVKKVGHYECFGATRDDAAGEAFDKFAQMLGLGFPGGALVDREARQGQIGRYHFPFPLEKEEGLDFSFSGLKAAASRLLQSLSDVEKQQHRQDLCACYQQTIVSALLRSLDRAWTKQPTLQVVVSGGVSANSSLRAQAQSWAEQKGIECVIPRLEYCTDNAAMIAWAGQLLVAHQDPRTALPIRAEPQHHPLDFIDKRIAPLRPL